MECPGKLETVRNYRAWHLAAGAGAGRARLYTENGGRQCSVRNAPQWVAQPRGTVNLTLGRNGTRSLLLRCNGTAINFRSHFLPEADKMDRWPREPTPGKVGVLHLMMDSLARAAFFRPHMGLARTAALLKSLAGASGTGTTHRSFVFNRYLAQSMTTADNMVPMYSGEPDRPNLFPQNCGRPVQEGAREAGAAANRRFIWNVAREEGYQVMYGSDGDGMLINRPADSKDMHHFTHSLQELWGRFKFPAALEGQPRGQQCFGDEHAVARLVRESLQFADTAKGVPKMMLMKWGQAHNRFPDAQQMDAHAHTLVRGLLDRADPYVLALVSDHGYGYQDRWERDVEKYPGSDFERLLPLGALVVPQTLLDTLPEGGAHLVANQQRLISAYDIHLTLENLLRRPSAAPLPTRRRIPGLRPGQAGAVALDLLAVEVPRDRTCAQAGVPHRSCLCTAWTVDPHPGAGKADAKRALDVALRYINDKVVAPANATARAACPQVHAKDVYKVMRKPKVSVGYNGRTDGRMGDTISLEFRATGDTRWRTIVELGQTTRVLEMHALHRYQPRQACAAGATPLMFCACDLGRTVAEDT